MNEQLWGPVWLSLKSALIASGLVFVIGLPLARVMASKDFPGKNLLEVLLTLPLVLPPTVVGFLLLLVFGRQTPLGKAYEQVVGEPIVFSSTAVVLAATVVALPLLYRSAKGAFESVEPNLERAARTLGASELKIFLTITLPLAWPGILAGVVLAFARALGEFGATLMLAGNLPGRTQTLPLAIYTATEMGDMEQATWYVAMIILISFGTLLALNSWNKQRLQPGREGQSNVTESRYPKKIAVFSTRG